MDQPTPEGEERTCFRTCPLCEATCGLEITVRGDRVHRIRGDRADVFSQGYLCPKGPALKQLHHDPDRLRAPMVRRTDADGTSHWETVGWDQAWEAVDAGLRRVRAHGNEALGLYLGNPNVHTLGGSLMIKPLVQAAATPNLFSASTVDQMPKHVSSGLLFGNPSAIPVPDLDRTDYLLMLGANPLDSNGSLCTAPDFPGRLKALRSRGGRLTVVDPVRTRTADIADEHLSIRPGSDAFWLCALLHEVLASGGGPAHLADLVDGFENLAPALAAFTPEAVAPSAGIDATTTRRIAAELLAAERSVVYGRLGTHANEFGTLASWAVDVINLCTGNLDREGGAMFPLPAHGKPPTTPSTGRGFRMGRWTSRVSGHPEVRSELPAAALAEEIDTPGPGQIRGLITVAGNPVLSLPDGTRTDAALAGLDFMVAVDIYLNETTRHADVILPPPSPLEKSHFDLAFLGLAVRNVANFSSPVFETDAPDESEILARLALSLSGAGAGSDPEIVYGLMVDELVGSATRLPGGPVEGRDPAELVAAVAHLPAPERFVDLMVRCGPYGDAFGDRPDGLTLERLRSEPHGIDLGPLVPNLVNVMRTPTGRIDVLHDLISGELVRAAATCASHAGGSDGPDDPDDPDDSATMRLIGRRHVRSNNSWMHNLDVLVKGTPRCTLWVHPADGLRLNLTDGDTARVSAASGNLEAQVEITDRVSPGVVSLPHGWGHSAPGAGLTTASLHPGVNANLLTGRGALDPLSGNATLNGVSVVVTSVSSD